MVRNPKAPLMDRRQVIQNLLFAGGAIALTGCRVENASPISGSASTAQGIAAQSIRSAVRRCVTDFGAVPGVNTLAQAKANTEAFRKALCSYRADFAKLKEPICVEVPAGDWYLFEGVTIPTSCFLTGAGASSTRIGIPAELNSNPMALFTLGRVIEQDGSLSSSAPEGPKNPTFGGFPYTGIRDCYLHTYGTAVDILTTTALVQNLWLQAGTGVHATGDGIIENIVVDGRSLSGLIFDGAQNYCVNNIYCYDMNYAITFQNQVNSIQFSNLILAYCRYAGILISEGATVRNINLNNITCVQNDAHAGTFLGCVYSRANQCELVINGGSFSNYSGAAIRNGLMGNLNRIILNNCVFDGSPAHPAYNQNNFLTDPAARPAGILTGNTAYIELNHCQFFNLWGPAISVDGTWATQVVVNGGTFSKCDSAGKSPIQVTCKSTVLLHLANVTSLDSVPLLNMPNSSSASLVQARFLCSFTNGSKDAIFNGSCTSVGSRVSAS